MNNKISNSHNERKNNNNNNTNKENINFPKNDDIKNIIDSDENINNNNNSNNNINNDYQNKNQKSNGKILSFNMDFNELEKERRYFTIIKKIVTTINFDFAETELSLAKNKEKNKNSKDNNNDNLNEGVSSNLNNIKNENNKNTNKKIKIIKVEKEKEMNLFDKFMIEYRKKLFYERELRKANQKMSEIIDEENKKINKFKKRYLKAKKQKYISLFHHENSIISNSIENKYEKYKYNEKKKRKVGSSHFVGINLNSMQDVEKKKMEILYRIKHDIKYKISRGDINLSEMDNFNKFQDKINDLKKVYENFSINLYVKELEEFFSSFEDELSTKEKNKYDEDRINNYLRRLKDDFNDKNFMRRLYEQKLCKVIDFNKINNINRLNETKNNEEM